MRTSQTRGCTGRDNQKGEIAMKRWVVLMAGVVLQTILGGVYAWSAFVPALTGEHGLSNGQCGMIFGVTIAVFSVVMIPGGRLLQTLGPRITAGIGALLFAAGYVVASFSGGDFWVLVLGIGCLTGAGIGAGYVCPLTVAMKWFPSNQGLVTGVAVAGCRGGATPPSSLPALALTLPHTLALSPSPPDAARLAKRRRV